MRTRLLALLAFSVLLISIFRLEPDTNRLDSQMVPQLVASELNLDENPASLLRLSWDIENIEIAKDSLRSIFKVTQGWR